MIVSPARTSPVRAFSLKKAARSRFLQDGLHPTEAMVLMENDPQFAGVHSRDTGNIYINDLAHSNATEAVNTVGHETQHYLDHQNNPNAERTEQYTANRENYAEIMGDATADYLGFNFAQSGSSLAGSNSHSAGSSLEERARNLNLLLENRALLGAENPDSLDSCGVICRARLQAANPATTSPVLPGVPGMGQEDNLDPNAAAALALERDLKKLGGFLGLGSGAKPVAALTEADIFGKTITEPFDVFDMLAVGQAYQMADGTVVVKLGVANIALEKPDSSRLNGYEILSTEQLGQQGGFLPHDPDNVITSTTTPIANANDVPGNVGGYPVSEWIAPNTETTEQGGLSSNTGTSVHEGHWSDNLMFAVPPKDREQINDSLSGIMGSLPLVDALKGSNEISHYPNGTREDADRVFDSMGLNNIGVYQTPKGIVKTGTLPDGTRITVRPSDDGRPTIEVYDVNRSSQRPVQKIRFGD